jgi:hypothetical protein
MPRGAKPKQYPPELVARVRDAYSAGMTQGEVAAHVGVTQKVVWKLMLRHGIKARVAAKRDQRGPKNHAWKGERAGYSAMHLRVIAERGQPALCEDCGVTEAPRFEWANLTGNYGDVSDYKRLCCSCHHKLDHHVENLGLYAVKDSGVKARRLTPVAGELNPRAKLTLGQVNEIRALEGRAKTSELADKYGVCETTIRGIQTRKNWRCA